MSNLTIGLLMGLGFGAWVYSKMMRSTGSNTRNSLIVAAVAAILAILVITTLLSVINK